MTRRVQLPPEKIHEIEENLLEILQRNYCGKIHAIKSNDLVKVIFGSPAAQDRTYNSYYGRLLREIIEGLIQKGNPICSSSSQGYWWPTSIKDGLPSATSRTRRALTQLKNARQLENNIRRHFGGQIRMESNG